MCARCYYKSLIINSYSTRTHRIWADIYNQQAIGRVGYYQLISGKSEKNNCFSKFSSNSLDFFRWNLLKSWHFLSRRHSEKIFPTSKISAQEICHQFFLIWSNLTIMALIIHQIFLLARDWSKRVTWANIPQLKLGNTWAYSPVFKTNG